MNASKIIDYYDKCEIDYRIAWDLKKSNAMHLGYWDQSTTTLRQALQRQNEVIADQLKLRSSDVVLDAGCGVGGTAIHFAKQIGCNVTGITISEKQCRLGSQFVTKSGVDHCHLMCADFHHTPFKNNSFDAVVAIESACYANPLIWLKEMKRILKPKGQLLVADAFANDSLSSNDQSVVQQAATGYCVEQFHSKTSFVNETKKHFRAVKSTDTTQNVLPSAKNLRFKASITLPLAYVLRTMGFGTDVQLQNSKSSNLVYSILKNGLCTYEFIHAKV